MWCVIIVQWVANAANHSCGFWIGLDDIKRLAWRPVLDVYKTEPLYATILYTIVEAGGGQATPRMEALCDAKSLDRHSSTRCFEKL